MISGQPEPAVTPKLTQARKQGELVHGQMLPACGFASGCCISQGNRIWKRKECLLAGRHDQFNYSKFAPSIFPRH